MYAEPGNMYRAINAGLRSCQTEWLTYVNSDDWLYPDSFSRLIALGEKTKADVVYGNCDFVDGQGRFLYSFRAASPRDLQGLFGAGVQGLAQPAAIFSRRLFERLDGFDEKYELAADADFFSRAISTGASFKFLAGPPTACFRQHEHQLSQTRGESMATECQEIRRAMGPQSRWEGWVAFTAWRMAKLPHYAIRTLRAASLGD
jgi:glycosyltransferase involved in cell wall biosynthesis